jgi:L-fuculose-phosphate aldolase
MPSQSYPTPNEARQLIVEIGRRMYEKNFVAANDGNISCRIGNDRILATPTGVSKGYMTEDMMVEMSMDGSVLSGGQWKPSSEVKMHLRVFNENPDAMGAVHAHPTIATCFAIAGIALDKAIYPEALVNLGIVPCVHYELPGSQGVPDSIAPYCKDYNAVLLSNHGALTWGRSLMEAFFRMESLEHYATILMNTGYIIGKARALSSEQIDKVVEIRTKLGTTAGGIPRAAASPTNLEDVVNNEE